MQAPLTSTEREAYRRGREGEPKTKKAPRPTAARDSSLTYAKKATDPIKIIKKLGEGGEAVVHRVEVDGEQKAFKEFRISSDPVYTTEHERAQVKVRMKEYPKKLAEFPMMPRGVVAPERTVNDPQGNFVGYIMALVERSFPLSKLLNTNDRKTKKISLSDVTEIFLDLHTTLHELHERDIVVGDFRPENILCQGHSTQIIDSESMQFGQWECHPFSEDWVDPLLCDPAEKSPVRISRANKEGDWFTFAAILFNAITGSHPYGGTLVKDSKVVPADRRPLNHQSIFSPGTILHPSVMKLTRLSPELAEIFRNIFENKWRGEFPREILENIVWTDCPKCKQEFSTSRCPDCGFELPKDIAVQAEPIDVAVERSVAPSFGPILASQLEDRKLRLLQYDPADKSLMAEDGRVIGQIENPQVYRKYVILGTSTGLVSGQDLFILAESGDIKRIGPIDEDASGEPAVDGNSKMVAAITNGKLVSVNSARPEKVEILTEVKNPSYLHVGPSSGFLLSTDDDGLITLSSIVKGKLKPVTDFPGLYGKISSAEFFSSSASTWLILKTQDSRSTRSFAVVMDSSTSDLQAWGKIDKAVADQIHLGGKVAYEEGGKSRLLSRQKKGAVVLQVEGGKVLLHSAQITSALDPGEDLFPGRGGPTALSLTVREARVEEKEISEESDDDEDSEQLEQPPEERFPEPVPLRPGRAVRAARRSIRI